MEGQTPSATPCACSTGPRLAIKLARFYAGMFPVGAKVIDLGFGQGYFLEAARARGLLPIGLDRDADLVDRAAARGFEVQVADVRQLESAVPPRIDGAIAAHLIEHLQPDEVRGLLDALAGKVVSGGLVVLVTPNMGDWRVNTEWFWNDPTHVRPYTVSSVRQLADPRHWRLEATGFEPIGLSRETPKVLLGRLRFGHQYGKSGRWFQLRRG
jgi:2-polyprenyl-3-methyl-5-hydroxy-6-metoxy-1,4-benzoquinol methylase